VLGRLVQALKYEDRRSVARTLSVLLSDAGGDLVAASDCVVPVPLHWWRQWRRGFNQSALLARRLGPPVYPWLQRIRATVSQTALPLSRRHANVRGAFCLSRSAAIARLEHRHVLLVDDVITTGATLEACARVLRAAGAAGVSALVVARAEARPR
jgi:ComF family protein